MRSAAPPSRLRRNLWIAAVLLLLYTIVGFAIVPAILKAQLQERLTAALGRTVTVGKVRFNPYACSVTLENFDIREKNAKSSFASWGRLYVNLDPLSSIVGQWAIGDVELEGFHVAATVESDGSLGFADILNRLNPPGAPPAPASPSARPIRVGHLHIEQAFVDFTDNSRPTPFATRVGPFTFNVTGFHTAGGQGAPYRFDATTESGEKLTWSGTIGVQPFRSVGDLSLENFVLGKYSPYESEFLHADITHGKLSVSGHYEVDFSAGHRTLRLDNSDVHIGDLKVAERGSHEEALDLPSIDLTRINVDAIAMKASVEAVNLNGGKVRVRRGQNGTINLLAMLPPSGEPSAPAATPSTPLVPTFSSSPGNPAATTEKTPDIMIGEVTTKDLQVEFKDLAAPRPAELSLTGIGLSLKKVTLADGATMPLALSFGWAPQGTVHVEGTLAIKPVLKANLKTEVTGLALLPLSPYLEQFVNARMTQGELTAGLTIAAELPAGGTLNATATGDVEVGKFGLVDGAHQQELAGVGDLQVKGIKLTMNPVIGVTVDEVALSHPYARVLVHSDKSLNLATVVKSDGAPKNDVTVSLGDAPKNEGPKIAINRVVINDGDFSFADHSVQPNVQTAINQFGGTITGLSSANLAKAAVDLKATVDGAGPVAITGQLDPLGAKKIVDLKIDVRNVDLQPVSPYSGKFAGYEIARGKLAFDAKILVEGKKIDSTEVITLNQFNFGAPTDSPDATKLPVRLGVALLKDTDGKIVIDVPVQGNMDDPEFRIGKVVLRVVVNLLTKAATSPFSLLGSMFGGGGDELAYQDFSPGSAELLPGENKKLETMVKALTNRPALNVSLEGSYDAAADTYALKQQKLRQTIRRAIWTQQHETSPTILPPEQLVISPEEQAAMVKQLFDAKFPPGTEFGAPLEKAPVVEAPPPPKKKRGFFGRVTDVVTLKKLREHREEKEEKAEEAKPEPAAVAAGPSLEEMTGRLLETMKVTDNDLTALAHARAKAVRDYFINVGKINPERLFMTKDQKGADAAKPGKGPRVFLELQ